MRQPLIVLLDNLCKKGAEVFQRRLRLKYLRGVESRCGELFLLTYEKQSGIMQVGNPTNELTHEWRRSNNAGYSQRV